MTKRKVKGKGKWPRGERPEHDVFTRIDMAGGNPNQCWLFKGWKQQATIPQYIVRMNGKRRVACRLVYSVYKGIPYEKIPRLTWLCDSPTKSEYRCCNPHHLVPTGERKKYRVSTNEGGELVIELNEGLTSNTT